MAARTIKPAQLQEAIQSILEEYSDDVSEVLEKTAELYAKSARSQISAGSPVGKGTAHSGKYKRGWGVEKQSERLGITFVVYNKANPGLTHLLEKGHVIRNGTRRTFGSTSPQPHIGPVEQQVINDFERDVKSKIGSI